MGGCQDGQICAVSTCKNYSNQKGSRSMYRFPRDKDICKKWLAASCRPDLDKVFQIKGPEHLNKTQRVCSDHFEQTCFRNPRLLSQGLVKGTIPTLQLGSLETRKGSRLKKRYCKLSEPETPLLKCSDQNDMSSISNTGNAHPIVLKRRKSATVTIDLPTDITMPRGCSAAHCTSSREMCPPLKLHRFPKNKERAIQWAINCGRPDLVDLTAEELNSSYKLCTLHFERHCFMNDLRTSLIKTAVPTIMYLANENDGTKPSSVFADLAQAANNLKVETEKEQQLNSNDIKSYQDIYLNKIIAHNYTVDQNRTSHEVLCDQREIVGKEVICSTSTLPISAKTEPSMEKWTVLTDGASSLNKHKLCRLCATSFPRTQVVHIFGKMGTLKEYLRKMNQLLPSSEQVTQNDILPQWICINCTKRLDYCDQIIQDFVAANVKLKHHFHKTVALDKHRVPMKDTLSRNQTFSHSQLTMQPATNKAVKTNLMADNSTNEENLQEDLEEVQFSEFTNQQPHNTNYATSQQPATISMVSRQEGISQPLPITNSEIADCSRTYKCLQCENMFSDKSSLFYHELTTHTLSNVTNVSEAKFGVKIIRRPQISHTPVPLENQVDVSDSDGFEYDNATVKRRADCPDNQANPSSILAPSPKIVKIVSEVDNSDGCKSEKNNFHGMSHSRTNKLVQPSELECQDIVIQKSHTIIPTSIGYKTFLCHVCNSSFDSIESVLTHRFKEHTQEEILQARPNN